MSIDFTKVKPEMFDECARVIRNSFITVATEFNLTKDNAPTNPAFIEVDSLNRMYQKNIEMFAVHQDDVCIGFVAIEKFNFEIYYMEKLAILPEYRHRGIGRITMDFVVSGVRDKGGKVISIGIIDENTILKNWYISYGFVEIETKKYSHLPFTVCVMEKRVQN